MILLYQKVIKINFNGGEHMTLRERTLQLIDDRGIKKSFIAKKLSISKSLFSLFINGKQPLQQPEIIKLEAFIGSYK